MVKKEASDLPIKFPTTVGIASTTIQTLDRSLFDASKSVIEVSAGSTKALHQVMMISDGIDVYTQQLPFLSVGTTDILDTASGIGTLVVRYLVLI